MIMIGVIISKPIFKKRRNRYPKMTKRCEVKLRVNYRGRGYSVFEDVTICAWREAASKLRKTRIGDIIKFEARAVNYGKGNNDEEITIYNVEDSFEITGFIPID